MTDLSFWVPILRLSSPALNPFASAMLRNAAIKNARLFQEVPIAINFTANLSG